MSSYVRTISEVSEESLAQMQSQARDVYLAYAAKNWGEGEQLNSLDYIGNYLLVNKDSASYRGNDNVLYLVFRQSIYNTYTNGGNTYSAVNDLYWYISFSNLLVDPDGVNTVDLSEYKTPGDRVEVDSGISSGWWSTKTWRYYGYRTLDDLKKAVVTTNMEAYNYEENIDGNSAHAQAAASGGAESAAADAKEAAGAGTAEGAAGTSLTGNILQEHQFNLDEIGGIEMHKDYKFSILSFIGCLLLSALAVTLPALLLDGSDGIMSLLLGVLLGLLCLAPTFIVYKRFWLKLFCAIIGTGFLSVAYTVSDENGFLRFLQILGIIIVLADLIIVCFVPNLVIRIKTKSAGGAVIIGSQKAMFRRETGDDYSGFAEVMPWEDTLMAMNEVGTMIDDLQKQGDYAIDKWSR